VLAIEVAASEKGAACASPLRGLIDRGFHGVRLVVSDHYEGIKARSTVSCPAPSGNSRLL
jgi:transposase-like protein